MSILQQQTKHCTFCNKEHKEHSEKLWNLHKSAVDEMLKSTRHKKIWPMQLGFGPKCKAVLSDGFEYNKGYILAEWLKPIYMSCSECGHYLGKIEEEQADVLDSLCLECFKQLTDQEDKPLSVTGSISDDEFGRRMALNSPMKTTLDLDNPNTWSDSFKEWHYNFIKKQQKWVGLDSQNSITFVEQHCNDCRFCKKIWFVKNKQGIFPYDPFKQKVKSNK